MYLGQDINQPLTPKGCPDDDTAWQKIQDSDAKNACVGRANRIDKSEWVKLCVEHSQRYEEWCQAQCHQQESATTFRQPGTTTCPPEDDKRGEPQMAKPGINVLRRASAPCLGVQPSQPNPPRAGTPPLGHSGSLGRVMKWQHRASRATKTQRNPVANALNGRKRSGSMASSASECSSTNSKPSDTNGKGAGTSLKPTNERDVFVPAGKNPEHVTDPTTGSMVPNALLKMSIKPSGVPLVTSDIEPPLQPITDNEIIVNKLGAIEDKRDPERTWNKVT